MIFLMSECDFISLFKWHKSFLISTTFEGLCTILCRLDSSDIGSMNCAYHLCGASLSCEEDFAPGWITLKVCLTILWCRTSFNKWPWTICIRICAPPRKLKVNWIRCVRLPAADGFHGGFNDLLIRHGLELFGGFTDIKHQEYGNFKVLVDIESLDPLPRAVTDKVNPVVLQVLRPESLRELNP